MRISVASNPQVGTDEALSERVPAAIQEPLNVVEAVNVDKKSLAAHVECFVKNFA